MKANHLIPMSRFGKPKRQQQGVALIVILLLLAIMVSIAATMSERLFSQFTRASSQINYQQAYWYSVGVEALAVVGIEQSYENNSDTVNLNQAWAIEEQTYPLDYGVATGRIRDMQACFNLNALSEVEPNSNSTSRPYLVSLFRELLEQSQVDSYQAEQIADSAWEFINTSTDVRLVSGVGDSYYESLSPAYVSANGLLADSSELRAVNQVTGDAMLKIAPLVCALPSTGWLLNVNTVVPEQSVIIAAMFAPNLSQDAAQQIIENRPFDGWDSVDDFLQEPQLSSITDDVTDEAKQYLAVDSAYFELDSEVIVDESRIRLRTLFYSEDRENVTVVRRRFGGFRERVPDRSSE
ncbi:type II secretion system minor pseudopilin GspK [Vibrio hippocampi]|nr:type II secretion system minor pseudopilin GspK [Vibrio hippocampi]